MLRNDKNRSKGVGINRPRVIRQNKKIKSYQPESFL